jgi:DNA-binding response OmpR family regulator
MKKIIVAEDDAWSNKFIVETLNEHGYEVVGVLNGEEALQAIHDANGRIDMLITDINMPKVNGYDLIHKLDTENYQFPILVQSASFDRSRVRYGGTLDFIVKPYSIAKDLTAKVKEMLGE